MTSRNSKRFASGKVHASRSGVIQGAGVGTGHAEQREQTEDMGHNKQTSCMVCSKKNEKVSIQEFTKPLINSLSLF